MNLDFSAVKDLYNKGSRTVRQYAEGLNELEIKVEEATNSEKWGPHGSLMQEITRRSFVLEDYKQILGILARRLHSEPHKWRNVYKSLLLLEYMAKNGPERMVTELKSNGRVFTKLQQFQYFDSKNKDQGINVRNRAKELWNLVNDSDAVALEREKAAKNRNKYGGMDNHGFTSSHYPDSGTAAGSAFRTTPTVGGASTSGISSPAAASSTPRKESKPTGAASADTATDHAEGSAEADAVAATQKRIQDLEVGDAGSPMASSASTGAARSSAPVARPKPKLSAIQVDSSIQQTFKHFAVQNPSTDAVRVAAPPKPQHAHSDSAAANKGLNLLDFDDDPDSIAEPGPAGQFPAPALNDNGSYEDLAALDAPSVAASAPAAAPDDFADPFGDANVAAAAPAGAHSAEADPFASVSASAPVLAAPAAESPGRKALPADAFADPAVVGSSYSAAAPSPLGAGGGAANQQAAGAASPEPFEPFQSGGVSAGSAAAASAGAGANGQAHATQVGDGVLKAGALRDKNDPFADLLGI